VYAPIWADPWAMHMILGRAATCIPPRWRPPWHEHPRVVSSCVIGLPDDEYGNTIHAVVQALEPLSALELDEFLGARLVKYKRPPTYEFVTAPLRADDGKVRRTALRAERIATRGATTGR
jgi:bile acid-coenzyme A ligase